MESWSYLFKWLISRVSVLALPIVWQLRITSKGKVGFSGKVKATVKVSRWVLLACCMHPVEMETKQRLTVVCIIALARYAVSRSSLSDMQSQEMYHTPVTAACQQLSYTVIRIPSGPMCLDKWLSTVFKSKGLVAKQHTTRYNCTALHCTNTSQRYNTVDREIFAVKIFSPVA